MVETLIIHGLFIAALAYLAWRFLGGGRKAGCGSCPSCPSQASQANRPHTVTLTVHATRHADAQRDGASAG